MSRGIVKKILFKFPLFVRFYKRIFSSENKKIKFPGSAKYWEERYFKGKTSGQGSYGKLALYKAEVINEFVKNKNINTVIEFGCGDGNQLKFAKYKNYIGIDISKTAIERCKKIFKEDPSKKFYLDTENNNLKKSDLSISLDVIYHLVEDEVFEKYMQNLFGGSKKYVLIYSSNKNSEQVNHVRHRNFQDWIKINIPSARQTHFIKNKFPYDLDKLNGSFADFYIYELDNG